MLLSINEDTKAHNIMHCHQLEALLLAHSLVTPLPLQLPSQHYLCSRMFPFRNLILEALADTLQDCFGLLGIPVHFGSRFFYPFSHDIEDVDGSASRDLQLVGHAA